VGGGWGGMMNALPPEELQTNVIFLDKVFNSSPCLRSFNMYLNGKKKKHFSKLQFLPRNLKYVSKQILSLLHFPQYMEMNFCFEMSWRKM